MVTRLVEGGGGKGEEGGGRGGGDGPERLGEGRVRIRELAQSGSKRKVKCK